MIHLFKQNKKTEVALRMMIIYCRTENTQQEERTTARDEKKKRTIRAHAEIPS